MIKNPSSPPVQSSPGQSKKLVDLGKNRTLSASSNNTFQSIPIAMSNLSPPSMASEAEDIEHEQHESSPPLCDDDKRRLVQFFLKIPSILPYREQIISLLEAKDPETIKSSDDTSVDPIIHERFEKFVVEETAISGSSRRYLLHPKGSLQSRLHVRCHYPSLLSSASQDSESIAYCGDPTSPSMAFLVNKGVLGHQEALVSEASFRCESVYNRRNPNGRARYPEDYGPELRQVHQEFADWLWDSSEATVVLLVGRSNEDRLRRRCQRAVEFQLPGFGVVPGHGYLLLDSDRRVSRIVICVQHPEHTIRYANYSQACQQDYLINLAVALSGISSPVRKTACADARQISLEKHCIDLQQVPLAGDIMKLLSHKFLGLSPPPGIDQTLMRELLGHSRYRLQPREPSMQELEALLAKVCPSPTKSATGRCAFVFCGSKAGRCYEGYCLHHWKVKNPGRRTPSVICRTPDCTQVTQGGCLGYCRKHYQETGAPKKYTCAIPDCETIKLWRTGYCVTHSKAILGFLGDPTRAPCKYENCETTSVRDGYCARHIKVVTGQPRRVCKFDGCQTSGSHKGFCTAHYESVFKTRLPKVICKFEECTMPNASRCEGYCARHFRVVTGTVRPEAPPKDCRYQDCRTIGRKKGYCRRHYRVVFGGLPPGSRCKAENCPKVRVAGGNGFCTRHSRESRGDNKGASE